MSFFWKSSLSFLALLFAVAAVCALPGGVGMRMVGGKMDADVGEEGVQDALKFAVAEFNKASNDMYVHRVWKVISAQKQVVSGIKYIVTVQMGRTSCRKGGAEKVELCAFHDVPELAKTSTCTFEVVSRLWIPETKLVKNTCN
ncbi:cystatin C (amyloid angiopathy and cerebral hemorrhage) [Polyodon spathula]|uniref:cystatin C (amyloid angiopathy and cerebral hemorrhage) n=1 Tax=Polyodon spathula TaxID=7913 RepID=UPI001B7EA85B|nr:cystatin C (amyloid angiopathy and cerebral hemorrhage) [Polyodon spathula]